MPPYTVDLSPDQARDLADAGGTLLFLDVPQGTLLGVDHQRFIVGPNFRGVKLLPPGVHLITTNAVGKQAECGPTTSFFVCVDARSVHVRRWDAASELLLKLPDEEEAARFEAGVRRYDFDRGLAPYDLTSYTQWRRLSNHISRRVVAKLEPPGCDGNFSVTAEADPGAARPATAAEARLAHQLEVGAARQAATAAGMDSPGGSAAELRQPQSSGLVGCCQYTPLPRLAMGAGRDPGQLTAANLDKSALLEDVLREAYCRNDTALLGELQVAFLAFLVGHSLAGFAQWKAILTLALQCEDAPLRTLPGLFAKLLAALAAQLELCFASPNAATAGEAALSAMRLANFSGSTFMRQLLRGFLGVMGEARSALPPILQVEVERLQEVAEQGFGCSMAISNLDNSDDEDAPVVVEL